MPHSPKVPAACPDPVPPAGWAPRIGVDSPPGQPMYSYTYGRLRPRFVTAGAWHELWCLVSAQSSGGNAASPSQADDLEVLLGRLFDPRTDGSIPDWFYLARELVWPLYDSLGVPQCVVVPSSDEQIVELFHALCASGPRCPSAPHCIVNGSFSGHASGIGAALAGLPTVDLISVFPYDIEQQVRPGCTDDRDRLFRSYQPLLANNGLGDEFRAINYVLTRSDDFYELASRLDERGCDREHAHRLIGMHALSVTSPTSRALIDVVFSFQRNDDSTVRRWSQRVDVGSPFMFFPNKGLQAFFARPRAVVRPQATPGLAPMMDAALPTIETNDDIPWATDPSPPPPELATAVEPSATLASPVVKSVSMSVGTSGEPAQSQPTASESSAAAPSDPPAADAATATCPPATDQPTSP